VEAIGLAALVTAIVLDGPGMAAAHLALGMEAGRNAPAKEVGLIIGPTESTTGINGTTCDRTIGRTSTTTGEIVGTTIGTAATTGLTATGGITIRATGLGMAM
jgi:hypothetical protein